MTTKSEAVELAARVGRALEAGGELAQVVIHLGDGTIEEERTYGADPRRSLG